MKYMFLVDPFVIKYSSTRTFGYFLEKNIFRGVGWICSKSFNPNASWKIFILTAAKGNFVHISQVQKSNVLGIRPESDQPENPSKFSGAIHSPPLSISPSTFYYELGEFDDHFRNSKLLAIQNTRVLQPNWLWLDGSRSSFGSCDSNPMSSTSPPTVLDHIQGRKRYANFYSAQNFEPKNKYIRKII